MYYELNCVILFLVARPERFELPCIQLTFQLVRSQRVYGRIINGAPERIRTSTVLISQTSVFTNFTTGALIGAASRN